MISGAAKTRALGTEAKMTYCLGIVMREGLVMASDSRSNASLDEVNVCQKMHTIVDPGERVFILLTSGNLSCSQSILTLLRRDFDQGKGLASASSMYDAARVVGEQVRSVADMDQPDLNKHNFRFNVHLLVAGQIRGQPHDLYLIYPQGNPLRRRRTPRSSRSASPSTAAPSSTGESVTRPRLWRTLRGMP